MHMKQSIVWLISVNLQCCNIEQLCGVRLKKKHCVLCRDHIGLGKHSVV